MRNKSVQSVKRKISTLALSLVMVISMIAGFAIPTLADEPLVNLGGR